MKIEDFAFGSIRIDGVTYEHDVLIDHGKIRKRKKKPSRHLKASFGHTPLSTAEQLPWDCRTLVVGTGAHGALPLTDELLAEAKSRHVELRVLRTSEAIEALNADPKGTNAVLHVTC